MSLVMRAAAEPFVRVKKLIQELIEKLVTEAAEQATKKGWCDTEMGKAENMDTLDKAKEGLAAVKNAYDVLASNTKASKDFKDAAEAVTEAISVLREYYGGALVQTQSASRASRAPPTLGGAKSDSAHVILSILEMSGEDFEELYMETEQSESEAASSYKKFDGREQGLQGREARRGQGLDVRDQVAGGGDEEWPGGPRHREPGAGCSSRLHRQVEAAVRDQGDVLRGEGAPQGGGDASARCRQAKYAQPRVQELHPHGNGQCRFSGPLR